jgi:hypothetical protein
MSQTAKKLTASCFTSLLENILGAVSLKNGREFAGAFLIDRRMALCVRLLALADPIVGNPEQSQS